MNKTAQYIAEKLNETNLKPLLQIERTVALLGEEKAKEYVDKAYAVDHEGGLFTQDETRRRTIGGIYFQLILADYQNDKRLFYALRYGGRYLRRYWRQLYGEDYLDVLSPEHAELLEKTVPKPIFNWDDRIAIFKQLMNERVGSAETEIKLVGQPIKVIEKPAITIMTMRSTPPTNFPKGMPVVPPKPNIYLIYILPKHWENIRDYVKKTNAKLIIYGHPSFDSKLKTITVFVREATAVSTSSSN